jgi:hypothetical protein
MIRAMCSHCGREVQVAGRRLVLHGTRPYAATPDPAKRQRCRGSLSPATATPAPGRVATGRR